MEKIKFNFYSDPGHGWLEVPKSMVIGLGLKNKITSYSYINGDFVYLEEDQDLGLFLETAKNNGTEIELNEIYLENSPIRDLNYYLPARV